MSKHALIPAKTEAEQQKLGTQIADLYVKTTEGLVDCVALGDLVAQARQIASTVEAGRVRGGGRDTKGDGLKAWLEQYAPSVPRTTAYRFEDLAECVRDELKVGVKVNLHHVLKGERIDPKEKKLREKVTEFVAGKSQRQILLEVGKYQAQIGGARTTTKKLTPEQEQAEWIAAAKGRAETALNEIHTLEERWKLLTDDVIEQAAKDAAAMAKKMKEWLDTPIAQRAAIDVKKYLGESTGAEEPSGETQESKA